MRPVARPFAIVNTVPHSLRVALLLLFAAPAFATTFHVDVETDSVDASPGDGVCADASGGCSLRAAIMESNALAGPDAIMLPAGHFTLGITGIDEDASAQGDLDVADDVAMSGIGSALSVIDGAAIDRVLDLQPANGRAVSLSALALVNGNIGDDAPGLQTRGAGLRVGLGVQLQMQDVDVRDNHTSRFGGAAGIDNFGCITGSHVRVIDNRDLLSIGSQHALAGGIVTNGAQTCFTLTDSEISGNSGDAAGAIYVDGAAPVTLRRTLIAGNAARFSGALELNHGADIVLENVTISDNAGNPGAILNDGGTRVFLVNSTVTGNHGAQGIGGAGALADVHGGFGLTFLSNTIVAGNGPASNSPDCERITSVDGGNIIGNTSGCMISSLPTDQLGVDPLLGALVDNGGFTRTHLAGAPAIDHGIANGCPATDQRGFERPVDGDGSGTAECDVGAVEMLVASDMIYADGFEAPGVRRSGPDQQSLPLPAFHAAAMKHRG